jgi:hypothetical protein
VRLDRLPERACRCQGPGGDAVAEQVQATLSQRLTGPIAALGAGQVPERAALIAAQLLGLALCR